MPTRKLKSNFWDQGSTCSPVWRDRRTGIVMAPGAVRNWPTRAEEEEMNEENARLRELARQEFLMELSGTNERKRKKG